MDDVSKRTKKKKQGLGWREKLWAEAETGSRGLPFWNQICEFFHHVECRRRFVYVYHHPPPPSLPPSVPESTISLKSSEGIFARPFVDTPSRSFRLFSINNNRQEHNNKYKETKKIILGKQTDHNLLVLAFLFINSIYFTLSLIYPRCRRPPYSFPSSLPPSIYKLVNKKYCTDIPRLSIPIRSLSP